VKHDSELGNKYAIGTRPAGPEPSAPSRRGSGIARLPHRGRSLAHVGAPGDLSQARLVTGGLIILLVAAAVPPGVVFVVWRFVHFLREESSGIPRSVRSSDKKLVVFLVTWTAIVVAVFALMAILPNRTGRAVLPPVRSQAQTTPNSGGQMPVEALGPWVFRRDRRLPGGAPRDSVAAGALLAIPLLLLRRRQRTDSPGSDS
jgi:hypothetical protein